MFARVMASVSIALVVFWIMQGGEFAALVWAFSAAMWTFNVLGDLK